MATGGGIVDKISGILGSSPRISKVDLTEAPPLRPSAPNFHVSTKDLFGPAANWKARDISKAGMADEVSRDFFGAEVKPVESGIPAPVDIYIPQSIALPEEPALPMDEPLILYDAQIYGESGEPAAATEPESEGLSVYA